MVASKTSEGSSFRPLISSTYSFSVDAEGIMGKTFLGYWHTYITRTSIVVFTSIIQYFFDIRERRAVCSLVREELALLLAIIPQKDNLYTLKFGEILLPGGHMLCHYFLPWFSNQILYGLKICRTEEICFSSAIIFAFTLSKATSRKSERRFLLLCFLDIVLKRRCGITFVLLLK